MAIWRVVVGTTPLEPGLHTSAEDKVFEVVKVGRLLVSTVTTESIVASTWRSACIRDSSS